MTPSHRENDKAIPAWFPKMQDTLHTVDFWFQNSSTQINTFFSICTLRKGCYCGTLKPYTDCND